MSLAAEVAEAFGRHRIPYALIGASALALRGVPRSTLDVDLLVLDRRALTRATYAGIQNVDVEIRRGDSDDPLLGVVRLRRAGEPDLDVVVGRAPWLADAIDRAEGVDTPYGPLRVVKAPDLVVLKLFAGGAQDLWDVQQLLALDDDGSLRRSVHTMLEHVPRECRTAWETVQQRA